MAAGASPLLPLARDMQPVDGLELCTVLPIGASQRVKIRNNLNIGSAFDHMRAV